MNSEEIGQTYREIGTQGAGKLELVVMLYDVLLDDLRRATEALRSHDIERRTAEIQHAMRILEQLQGSLDMTQGEPARNLDRLYAIVRGKLLEAHWKSSEDILRAQVELLQPVRDAWQQAREIEARTREPEQSPALPPPGATEPPLEWRV